MQSKPVGWFEIYVKDMQRAKAFYEAVFAVRLEKLDSPDPDMEMWAFPGAMDESKGVSGALVKMNGAPSSGNGTVVYFTSKDCVTDAGRVPSNGGKITQEKFSIGQYGFTSLITDTEGNLIGLHSMQ